MPLRPSSNASYSNIRRYLNNGNLPPVDAVKVEEMINYFSYEYSTPEKGEPFGVTVAFYGEMVV